MKKSYTLKTLVLARLLAEVTVLVVLAFLPAMGSTIQGLKNSEGTIRMVCFGLSALAVCLLPFYGFITWKVDIDEAGLSTYSLFKRRSARWAALKALELRSNFGGRRYVIKFEGGEATFPVWLEGYRELVQIIASRLPGGAARRGGNRVYQQSGFELAWQLVQLLVCGMFMVCFWLFVGDIGKHHSISVADSILLACFCTVLSLILIWRFLVILMMPRKVEVTGAGLRLKSWFHDRALCWEDINSVHQSFFLLPEGLMVKSRSGSFLVSDGIPDVDELKETIIKHLKRSEPLKNPH